MGPPGAGKGTQAKQLTDRFHLRHLSSGDILRAEKTAGTPLGKTLARYMDSGKLVPDDVVVKVMASALSANNTAGLLLDGFPRTVEQAKALDTQLAEAGKALDAVIVMDAAPALIVRRISGRRSCPKCGRVYHVETLKPRRPGVCDDCGTPLVLRDDDREEVVQERLEAYRRQTEPVIAYYRKQPGLKVIDVDGAGTPQAVLDSLTAKLAELGLSC
jgi:adenylate kinase